ncbi:MAG: metalloregulator ArsR/SmtB family transcription factor [bacterium]
MNANITDLFKTLSDPTRLRILILLTKGELCICDITEVLSLPQSTVSRQMSRLKLFGLVTDKRQGKWVFYKLKILGTKSMNLVFELLLAESDKKPFASDLQKLENHEKCNCVNN